MEWKRSRTNQPLHNPHPINRADPAVSFITGLHGSSEPPTPRLLTAEDGMTATVSGSSSSLSRLAPIEPPDLHTHWLCMKLLGPTKPSSSRRPAGLGWLPVGKDSEEEEDDIPDAEKTPCRTVNSIMIPTCIRGGGGCHSGHHPARGTLALNVNNEILGTYTDCSTVEYNAPRLGRTDWVAWRCGQPQRRHRPRLGGYGSSSSSSGEGSAGSATAAIAGGAAGFAANTTTGRGGSSRSLQMTTATTTMPPPPPPPTPAMSSTLTFKVGEDLRERGARGVMVTVETVLVPDPICGYKNERARELCLKCGRERGRSATAFDKMGRNIGVFRGKNTITHTMLPSQDPNDDD